MVRMIRWCCALLLLTLPAGLGCSGSGPSKVRGAEVRTPTNKPPPTVRLPPETDLDDDANPVGVTVEPPAYWLVADTRHEYFRVESGSFSGLLDRFGQELVPPRYHEILNYDSPPNRWFLVVNGWMKDTNTMWGGRWGLVQPDGTFVLTPQFDWIAPVENGRARTEQRPRFGLLRVGPVK